MELVIIENSRLDDKRFTDNRDYLELLKFNVGEVNKLIRKFIPWGYKKRLSVHQNFMDSRSVDYLLKTLQSKEFIEDFNAINKQLPNVKHLSSYSKEDAIVELNRQLNSNTVGEFLNKLTDLMSVRGTAKNNKDKQALIIEFIEYS